MATAMVLAAGRGTRLRPLSDLLPKPLVPVGDRPLLAHVLEHLASQGHTSVVANAYHLARRACSWEPPKSVELRWSVESELLGSAGGVAQARQWLLGPALIWNGDIFAEPNLESLMRPLGGSVGRLLVADADSDCGTVGLDSAGNVVRLRGERFGIEVRSADYVGIQVLSAEGLARLPARGCLFGDFALPLLRAGARFETARHDGPWIDVGSPRGYLDANLRWLDGFAPPDDGGGHGLVRGGRSDGGRAWVGEGAIVEPGVTLERSVVGAGATIDGTGDLVHCVVWPGAQARAPLRDAVVLPDGQVVSVSR